MKKMILLLLAVPCLSFASTSETSLCKGESKSAIVFDLTQLQKDYALNLRFESYLEYDLHLITASPSRMKLSVVYADGTTASYPHKWCSISGTTIDDGRLNNISTSWDLCKKVAETLRLSTKGKATSLRLLVDRDLKNAQSEKLILSGACNGDESL